MKKALFVIIASCIFMQASAEVFQPIIRVTYEAGADSQKNTSFGMDFIGDIVCSPFFSIGLGTGIYYSNFFFQPSHWIGYKLYDAYYETGAYVPVFADIKIKFLSGGSAPYLRVNPGYSSLIPFSDYARESIKLGIMLEAAAGYDISLNTNSGLFIEAGYKYQKMSSKSILYTGDLSFNQLRITLGYNF